MLKNVEALWAKILKGKYFPNTSLWPEVSILSKRTYD